MSVPGITPAELNQRLETGQRLVLLDVREDHERDHCAIAVPTGVVDLHIAMGQVPARLGEVTADSIPIVVYCHHGVRSMVVARWMAARGVTSLFNLDGGIDAWSVSVDPGVPRY